MLITVGASLCLMVVSGMGLYQTHQLIQLYQPIAKDSLPVTAVLGDLIFKFRQIRIEVRSIPLRGNTPEQIRNYVNTSTAAIEAFEAELKDAEKFWDTAEEKEAYAKFSAGWQGFKSFGGGRGSAV
ncbi:MAG: MCP four helix bundle domain-containing protein [Cryobacterium sp.]|nr:MCP four helix bundle domain-containing protein [Oligoflexia bacterium]